jgi:hypothetical protein
MDGKQILAAIAAEKATWNGDQWKAYSEAALEDIQGYLRLQSIPDWAKADFDAAVKAGITDGAEPATLIPRYQAAIMAYRATKK